MQALRSHDSETALQLARDFAHAYPDDPRGWTLQGIALQALNRPAESLQAYEQALQIDPNNLAALQAAGQLEFQAGKADARPFLEKLLALKPDDPTAHAMLGALSYQQKDCNSAVEHYQRSAQIVMNDIPALSQLGSCLFRLNRPNEALPVFERIAELRPGDPEALYYLGLAQYSAHRYKEAVLSLQPLTEGRGAQGAAALNLMAAAYEGDQQTPQAVAALQKAISVAPSDIGNYLDLATLCLDHGSFQLGVDVLNSGLRAVPDSAPLYLERGVLEVQLGDYDKAHADFQRASALNPNQNDSSVALGISLIQESKPQESVQVLKQRLEKSPDDPELNYLLAELLLRSGVKPGTASFHEAETAAKRAAEGKPNFTSAQNLLTELYLRASQMALAEETARKALQADPEDQSALYNLIICLRAKGDRVELAQMVQRLAEVTAHLREEEKAQNRYRLVEGAATSAAKPPP